MLKTYFKTLVNIFFPRLCLSCDTKITQGYICPDCYNKIALLKPPLCRYCANPIETNPTGICNRCLNKGYPYNKVISATTYREPLAGLIQLFKYKNYDFLAELLSGLIIKQLSRIRFNPFGYDFIIPVPMHKNKLKMRGYNQSELLAKLLSNYFKIPLRNDIITDVSKRFSQTKFSKTNRQENVKGVFKVKKNVEKRNLILVDDILTTGSTVKACCQELRKNKANIITVITLAKT